MKIKENLKRIHRENAIREAERKKDMAYDEFVKAKAAVANALNKLAAKIGKKPETVTYKDMMEDSNNLIDYFEKLEQAEEAREKFSKACDDYMEVAGLEE